MIRTRSTFLALTAVLLSPTAANADIIITHGSFEMDLELTALIEPDGTGCSTRTHHLGYVPEECEFKTQTKSLSGGLGDLPASLSIAADSGRLYATITGLDTSPSESFQLRARAFDLNPGGLVEAYGGSGFVRIALELIFHATDNTDSSAEFNVFPTGSIFDLTSNTDLGDRSALTAGHRYRASVVATDSRLDDDLAVGSFNFRHFNNVQYVTVPEPGTLALLGIGLAAMGLNRRRKNA